MKSHFVKTFAVLAAINLFGLSPALAVTTDVDNGNFNTPGLAGWTVVSGIVREKEEDRGYAYFEEYRDSNGNPVMSLLTQGFILPAGARALSFEFTMDATPNTETFTASLLSGSPEYPYFYRLNSDGLEQLNPNDGTVTAGDSDGDGWTEVTLDLSLLSPGQNVLLKFGFIGEDVDTFTTSTVSLDNVKVILIPAPGAMALVGIGCGIVGLLRRAKKV